MRVRDAIHIGVGPLLLMAIAAFGYAAHGTRPKIRALGPAWTELTTFPLSIPKLVTSAAPALFAARWLDGPQHGFLNGIETTV